MSWTNQFFGYLGAIELSCIIFLWLVIIIGFIAIISTSTQCLIILLILLFLGFLFSLFLAIILFIGTKTRYWNESLGCDTKYEGIYRAWRGIDVYIQAVDETFCGKDCKCYFNRTTYTLFSRNTTTAPYLATWFTRNVTSDAKRIQDCADSAYKNAYNKYLERNAYFKYNFKQKWFDKYFGHVEDFFKCTGFCSLDYFNENTQTNSKIVKYLFSDVTKGIPLYFGCLQRFLDWLRKTMNAVASMLLFVFVLFFILFIIVLLLISENGSNKDNESENEIEKEKEKEDEIEESYKIPQIKPKPKPFMVNDNIIENNNNNNEDEKIKTKKDDDKNNSENSKKDDTLNLDSFIPENDQLNENSIKFTPSEFKPK
jgi:ABC-type multidrug transport system fused ATPase/permease subunit